MDRRITRRKSRRTHRADELKRAASSPACSLQRPN
jgi:hypothetical protein